MITDKKLLELSEYVRKGWPDCGKGTEAMLLLIREVRSQRRKVERAEKVINEIIKALSLQSEINQKNKKVIDWIYDEHGEAIDSCLYPNPPE